MTTTIDRRSSFWEQCFLVAYGELARRVPADVKTFAGREIARRARFLADDCLFVRDTAAIAEPHGECEGLGCEGCYWTGHANATGPLVAPPDKSKTIPIEAPPHGSEPAS